MRIATRLVVATALMALVVLATSCVQMPTEKQQVADMRPTISFRLADPTLADARVFVDEIGVGSAGDFVEGQAALRVLPGSHVLRVVREDRILLNEKVYLGDGVSRAFILK